MTNEPTTARTASKKGAGELTTQTQAMFERIKKLQADLSVKIQTARKLESRLRAQEKQAELERKEAEKNERLRRMREEGEGAGVQVGGIREPKEETQKVTQPVVEAVAQEPAQETLPEVAAEPDKPGQEPEAKPAEGQIPDTESEQEPARFVPEPRSDVSATVESCHDGRPQRSDKRDKYERQEKSAVVDAPVEEGRRSHEHRQHDSRDRMAAIKDSRPGDKRTGDKFGSKKPAQKDKGRTKQKNPDWRAADSDDDTFGSKKRRKKQAVEVRKPEPVKIERAVMTTETISIKELSEKIGKPVSDILGKLLMMGIISGINQQIDYDTAALVAAEYDIDFEYQPPKTMEDLLSETSDDVDPEESLKPRPPVVTIMGHVDHGKTSLLDAIRNSRVTAGEAGGITQHIGAYQVKCNGRDITFIDTPGHEAFTSMRARGAQVTDIVILVVAADDGIMPQTIEAINHAKAAEVPIIVAVNKMDKDTANPDRIMQQLTEHGLVVEQWGGDTIFVPVSAKTHMNLDLLLEMVLLQADMLDLKANPDRLAKGIVVEAELHKGKGPIATVLVQKGTLHVGDPIVAGCASGKVRGMIDDKGRRIDSAIPGQPVEVQGFSEVPSAGDVLTATTDEKMARQVAEYRRDMKKKLSNETTKVTLDDLFSQIAEGQVKDLNLVVKADVQGSVEAIKAALEKLSNEEVRVRCIHGGVGAITGSDVIFASASNAIIIGFNVRPDPTARAAAEKEKVDMRLYSIIYNAIEDIQNAMKGMFAPVFREVELGRLVVRETFKVSGVGTIAGAYVQSGKVSRNAQVRVVRGGIVLHTGKIGSLKRFKDDVKEVLTGYECGIGIENFNDIQVDDVIEAFEMEEIKR